MQRKNILIFIDWFLPGTKSGGPVRSYVNMIAHLGNYHNFYVITRDADYCSDEVYENVQSNSWNQLDEHTFVYYVSKDRLNKANLEQLIDATAFDVAYINGIYSWYFSILPLWLLRKHPHVMVAARGMLNPQAFSVKKTKKKFFLAIAKFLGLYRHVTFHATNEDESNHIKQVLGQQHNVMVAPNLPRISGVNSVLQKVKSNPTRFVNVARISKEKGTLTMINALQNVKQAMVLDMFGPIYDDAYWDMCQKSIQLLPEHIKVTYKGVLPSEEVPETLQQYDFFVLLSEGENFGHAILEAFMAGLPVIVSDRTPWQDLQSKGIGWDINTDQIKEATTAFDAAMAMTEQEYHTASTKAIRYSEEFSANPELLMLNLNLFKS